MNEREYEIPMELELKWAKEILTEQNKHLDKLLAENNKLREDLREDLREGISLRDHFAGLAMQVLLVDATSMNNAARNAYDMADLMLTERGKNENEISITK